MESFSFSLFLPLRRDQLFDHTGPCRGQLVLKQTDRACSDRFRGYLHVCNPHKSILISGITEIDVQDRWFALQQIRLRQANLCELWQLQRLI